MQQFLLRQTVTGLLPVVTASPVRWPSRCKESCLTACTFAPLRPPSLCQCSGEVLPSALLLGDAHCKHACCLSAPAMDTPESRSGHGPSSISVPDQESWQTVNMSIWGKRHGSVVPLRNPNNDEVYWVSRASSARWDFVTNRMCHSFLHGK